MAWRQDGTWPQLGCGRAGGVGGEWADPLCHFAESCPEGEIVVLLTQWWALKVEGVVVIVMGQG
jgi:hypothetical protein